MLNLSSVMFLKLRLQKDERFFHGQTELFEEEVVLQSTVVLEMTRRCQVLWRFFMQRGACVLTSASTMPAVTVVLPSAVMLEPV